MTSGETSPSLIVDQSALTRLGKKLVDYYHVLKRLTLSEIIEKKGNDLRIQLYRLFAEERFGGKSGRKSGIAWRELKRRSKAGIGTMVREKSLNNRWGAPPALTQGTKQKAHKLSLWQQLVWQETTRRQRGIGVLGVSFLSNRFRYNKQGKYLVENKSRTLGTLVQIKKDDTSYTITGFTPGMVEVANRYNIADRAIAEVEKDLDKYLDRKLMEARRQVFNN
jgi:hypothetical protein